MENATITMDCELRFLRNWLAPGRRTNARVRRKNVGKMEGDVSAV